MQDTDVKLIDVRDKRCTYGNLVYSKQDDNIYFINTNGIRRTLVNSNNTRQIIKHDDVYDNIKYSGEWEKDKEYHMNSMVKYKSGLYLAKTDIKEVKPVNSTVWEPIIDIRKQSCKEIAKLVSDSKEEILIRRKITPITFKLLSDCSFIEYINHDKSLYITRDGRYHVTYNISYQSDIEHLSVLFYVKQDNENKALHVVEGTSHSFKGKTDNIVNVNHSFCLEVTGSVSNDDHSYNEGNDGHKLILALQFDEKEFGKVINIMTMETWIQMYEL